MLLMIDNYDSFTYNIVQYFGELGQQVEVVRNDAATLADLIALKPTRVVVSPGPCSPDEAGLSCDVIRHFGERIPVLGVCLGHQCLGQVYGGRVVRADRLMHGKTSPIHHAQNGLFQDLPTPLRGTRYHSLLVEAASLPECLVRTAWTEEGEIMGLRHRDLQVHGVQFHPESVLSEHGHQLFKNFLSMA